MPQRAGVGNSKKEAGQARKAEQKRKVAQAAEAEKEAQTAAAWAVGAKSTAKSDAAAAKADEAARKRREKAELLAAEQEQGKGTTASAKKALAAAAKKKKNSKQNDLSMLEDALQSSADKTVKKKRAQEAAKQKAQEEEERKKAASNGTQQPTDPLLANTDSLLEGAVGRAANQAQMEGASGIDAALDALHLKGTTPAKTKALYSEFEAKMLPIVKEEQPGLRLSQYKERVFALWKKSPENPANAVL